MAFSMHFSPRAAGRRRQARRLRRLPVGGPPLGEFFLQNWFKLMILMYKSSILSVFNECSHQNMMWNIFIFMRTHFFQSKFDKKKWWKNFFLISKKIFFFRMKKFFYRKKKLKILGNPLKKFHPWEVRFSWNLEVLKLRGMWCFKK